MFLANAKRAHRLPHQPLRQAVVQPATGTGDNFNILLVQPHLFSKFTKQSLSWRFIGFNATLRKLPGILTQAPRPQQLAVAVAEHNTYIRAKAVFVDQGSHRTNRDYINSRRYLTRPRRSRRRRRRQAIDLNHRQWVSHETTNRLRTGRR